jgi:hypothetical protein
MGCPTHGQVYGGVAAAMQVQVFTQGAEWCALGYHAWMPWLPITADDGRVLRYETYCVRCRHPEQFDL